MKFAGFVIVVIILIQLAWFILPHAGSSMGDSYRNQERIVALKQNAESPSPATQFAVEQEMKLLSVHLRNRNLALFVVNLAIDVVLILTLRNLSRRQGLHRSVLP